MILFVLLAGLAIDRIWDTVTRFRRFDWFSRYETRLRHGPGAGMWWDGRLGALLVLLFPLVVVALVEQLLANIWGLLSLLFAIGTLVYSLGPRDLDEDVQRYVDARERGDEAEAWLRAREINASLERPADGHELDRFVIEGILIEAQRRIVGVIVWFVLMGPAGAVLFRLTCILRDQGRGAEHNSGYARAVELLYAGVAWLPSRITALAYALVGSFADALFRWREETAHWVEDGNHQVLVASGMGALQAEHDFLEGERPYSIPQVHAALAMVWRAVILLLILIAIVTLASWLF